MFNNHRMVKSINIYQYNGILAVIKIHVCRECIMTQENAYIITNEQAQTRIHYDY